MRSFLVPFAAMALAGAASAEYVVIDDFSTGIITQSTNSGSITDLVTGSMLGGDRLISTIVDENLYGQNATSKVSNGLLLMNNDSGVNAETVIGYGFGESGGGYVEEDLDLKDVNSFRLTMRNPSDSVLATISVRSANNGVFSYNSASNYLYGYSYGSQYDQVFDFNANQFGLSSFADVDQISVRFNMPDTYYQQYGRDTVITEFGYFTGAPPVPEPASIVLLGLGGLGFLVRKRAKRA